MASREDIELFLGQIIEADEIRFIPREKNRQTMYQLGLTILDCEAIIKSLTHNDYHSGPLDDYDESRSRKIWIFKTNHQEEILYIKLKEIEIVENDKIMKCLSCHIDNMEI